jgi:3-hydroxy-3-methylglutaryl CoA synthase
MMRDVPEFAYLKSFEEIFRILKEDSKKKSLPQKEFDAVCAPYPFTDAQKALLAVMLKEKGFDIE